MVSGICSSKEWKYGTLKTDWCSVGIFIDMSNVTELPQSVEFFFVFFYPVL